MCEVGSRSQAASLLTSPSFNSELFCGQPLRPDPQLRDPGGGGKRQEITAPELGFRKELQTPAQYSFLLD